MRSFFKQLCLFQTIACVLAVSAAARALPSLPPMPAISQSLPPDSVPLGALTNSPEVKLDLPIAPGPFRTAVGFKVELNQPIVIASASNDSRLKN